jgi:hypothetical protein
MEKDYNGSIDLAMMLNLRRAIVTSASDAENARSE